MIWPFRKPKPATRRRTLDGATVKTMLWDALKHATTANYRHLTLKDKLTVCDMDAIAAAGRKAFMPWKKDVWECEDQARALLHECQRRAANEGCSWACGILRGDDSRTHDINPMLHVWLWAIVEKPGATRFPECRVMCYDATAQAWADLRDINDVDFSMT
jgi:hypothetical protein